MNRFRLSILGALLASSTFSAVYAAEQNADETSLQSIRKEIRQMQSDYEKRMNALQKRLQTAEQVSKQNQTDIQTVTDVPQASSQTRSNAFNPNISLILQGTYANLDHASTRYSIAGFPTIDELEPQFRGFSLAESELVLSATIDPYFYGGLNLALTPDNEVEIEQAFVQTIALPDGFTVKVGRFFSDLGYLNTVHQHAWDFFDAPLVYQAFLGAEATGNYSDDGIQLSWIAPTDLFLELGAHAGRGLNFPGSDRNRNSANAFSAFAKLGGDIGASQSYVGGLSYLHTEPHERAFNNPGFFGDVGATSTFSGNTDLLIADGVWKWAPNGNPTYHNAKFQSEFFYRRERGDVVFDPDGVALTSRGNTARWGFYTQGIYQFIPRWRTGLRFDYLGSGDVNYHANNTNLARTSYDPRRYSWMVDFSPSEFSRLRLQYSLDQSAKDRSDNQIILQYIYSLGSHGAHQF